MKHVELICELMVAAHNEDVTNKKASLDKAMQARAFDGRTFEKTVRVTVAALNRLKHTFPRLKHTRFSNLSDFYSLAVLFQKFEREGLVLVDKRSKRLAWELLEAFGVGVDEVKLAVKEGKGAKPNQELFRQYFTTVISGTDEINHRRLRGEILRGLLESIFHKKDSDRSFSEEQRRILWNTTVVRKCKKCGKKLTWDDFTIDHIRPYSKGGRTALNNAALLCREHNSAKGARYH